MTILPLRNSVNHAPLRRGVLLIALTLASFALSPTARAQLASTSEMAGGGSVFVTFTGRVTHGFEVHCGTEANLSSINNNLDINWGPDKKRHHFQLDSLLIAADCFYDPSVNPNPPPVGFNTFVGDGTGKFDGKSGATIHFLFTDAGEPGGTNGTPPPDTAAFLIIDASCTVVLNVPPTALTFGNHQAISQ